MNPNQMQSVVKNIDEIKKEIKELNDKVTGNQSPWLSIEEVANYLHVSKSFVFQNLCKILPFRQILPNGKKNGRKRVIHKDDVDAYIRSQGKDEIILESLEDIKQHLKIRSKK